MCIIAVLIIILLEVAIIIINKRIYSSITDATEIPLMKGLPNGLPILALKNNNNWLYFIVDTGSNISMLAGMWYDKIKIKKEYEDPDLSTTGIGGTISYSKQVLAEFEDVNGIHFNIEFSMSEQLNDVASAVKGAASIEIAGLLGTDFLCNNGYIIDFNSLTLKRKPK